jgi:hypothetical protein
VERRRDKMKKAVQKFFLLCIFLGVVTLLIPSYSAALPTVKLGEETQIDFYGFLRNNLGMFTDNPQPFAENSNDLATVRTWLRAYTDFKITNQFRFFMANQFIYEPEYWLDHGAGTSRTYTGGPSKQNGKEYSEYQFHDVFRELYLEWKPNKTNQIRIGRQIAIWGEAMTSRVGDVIHPDDSRFGMVSVNLDDTRIPSWMIRATHDFPSINSSFEWIYNPNIVRKDYTVSRTAALSFLGEPGQRFNLHPETSFDPPFSVGNPLLGFIDPAFAIPDVMVVNPLSRGWSFKPFPPFNGWSPDEIPAIGVRYPQGWGKFSRGGFRTNTTLSGWNFGMTYFHTQNYTPVIKREGIIDPGAIIGPPPIPPIVIPPTRQYTMVYPNIDIIGAYFNKQLPWPGVLRGEAIYIPNMVFNTFDLNDFDAVVRRDYIKYMIAYDLTSFLYFQWHKTAPFDVTFEHVGEIIPKNEDIQYIIYATEQRKWNPAFNLRISTNWFYNLISTDLIVGYLPWGHSGLVIPSVKFTPNWFDKRLSVQLQYINVFGQHNKGLGILKTKDMILLTTQIDW